MVILLDIDGVLVTEPSWRKVESEADGFMRFNKESADNLRDILAQTDAAVVLTTTHRINFTDQQWLEIFRVRGISVGNISKLNDKQSLAEMKDRGTEIEDWVRGNHDTNFVILDDDQSINQLPEWIIKRWVKIKPFKGIDDEAKEKSFIDPIRSVKSNKSTQSKILKNKNQQNQRNQNKSTVMNGQNRSDIYPGLEVDIILKKDQRTGTLTRGFVKRLLTSAAYHSRGIKVQLDDGQVGRVAWIVEEDDF